ncbi:hypothetical protein [Bosea sp. (in: a-proteobacteria)]|uniref:hypothetical protein n=1 Tax=Bosea sp. (in: a-proteobacteria) TaxID=1871050 RepID=UPI00262FCBC9|nr:hypothetical protein [Bosea sp. (in: a-proteobacteria)]MCO5093442.1 hypothetical protein [Bosea sp. (in: a-proteobacteria)]
MMGHELREFVDRVMDRRAIDEEDVKLLQRDILNDIVVTRDIVDVLVALDRAVPQSAPAYADYLVALVVDFAVWENRPTGVIDRGKAHWLVTTLSAGEGPTATAQRIAFEIAREAEHCDEALIAFAFARGAAKDVVRAGIGGGAPVWLAS